MADQIYGLTDEDRRILTNMIAEQKNRSGNTTGRQGSQAIDHEEILAPEVYLAKVPGSGITAMTTSGGVDIPGSASCNVYRLLNVSGVTGLYIVTGLTRTVYNLSSKAIPAPSSNTYIRIVRDKFGSWVADWGVTSVACVTGSIVYTVG